MDHYPSFVYGPVFQDLPPKILDFFWKIVLIFLEVLDNILMCKFLSNLALF